MFLTARTLVAATLLALAAGPALAARVDVSLVNPSDYTDAGNRKADEAGNVDVLVRHVQALGARLPADQVLAIELLDVDLAGTVLPRASGTALRVVRGNTDSPRIKLRYTLVAPGQAAVTREEEVRDITFSARGLASSRRLDPLYHEKRMLERWFSERFAVAAH